MGRKANLPNAKNVSYVEQHFIFSFAFNNPTRYEAFKALFEAIEQEAPDMVKDLQPIADLGKLNNWRTIEGLRIEKNYGISAWEVLTQLANGRIHNHIVVKNNCPAIERDDSEPLKMIRNALLVWGKKYHIDELEWGFMRDAAILAIIAYKEQLSDDEIQKRFDENPKTYIDEINISTALTQIVPPPPKISLSKHCHMASWWEKKFAGTRVNYMDGTQNDNEHLFEGVHPFVFAPTLDDPMNDLPEALQQLGYHLPITPHPAEGLLNRFRALLIANTPTQEPDTRREEISRWFYGECELLANIKLYMPMQYIGLAYDPRGQDWSTKEINLLNAQVKQADDPDTELFKNPKQVWKTFETELDRQYEAYKLAYKQATEEWLEQQEYRALENKSKDYIAIVEKAKQIIHYFIIGDSKKDDFLGNTTESIRDFFNLNLGVMAYPKKPKGRPQGKKNRAK
jgi:hypothetical protein